MLNARSHILGVTGPSLAEYNNNITYNFNGPSLTNWTPNRSPMTDAEIIGSLDRELVSLLALAPRPKPVLPLHARQTKINEFNRDVIYPLYNDKLSSTSSMYGYGYNPSGELTYCIDETLVSLTVIPYIDGYVIINGNVEIKISLNTQYLVARDNVLRLTSARVVPINLDTANNNSSNRILITAPSKYIFHSNGQTVSKIQRANQQMRSRRLRADQRYTSTYVLTSNPNEPIDMYMPLYVGAEVPEDVDEGVTFNFQPSSGSSTSARFGGTGAAASALAGVEQEYSITTRNGPMTNAATYTISANAGANVNVTFNYNTGLTVRSHAGAMASAELSNVTAVNSRGFGITTNVAIMVRTGAEVDGTVDVRWTPDNVSLIAGGNAFAGLSDSLDLGTTFELGQVSVGAGGGVRSGYFVAAGGTGSFTVRDGVVSLSASGNLGALVGLKLDLDLSIDFNPLVDRVNWALHAPPYVLIGNEMISAAELVSKEVLTVAEAILTDLISVQTAIVDGLIDVNDAIRNGYITATQAVGEGFITGYAAVSRGFISAYDGYMQGIISLTNAVVDFDVDVADWVSMGYISVTQLADLDILDPTKFVGRADQLLLNNVISIRDYIRCTGQDAANITNIAVGLIGAGLTNIDRATEQLGAEVGNSIASTIQELTDLANSIADAISDAFDWL